MPSAGFESATPATKRPQTYALDRAGTEVCKIISLNLLNSMKGVSDLGGTQRAEPHNEAYFHCIKVALC
jgi:hypothetical protein